MTEVAASRRRVYHETTYPAGTTIYYIVGLLIDFVSDIWDAKVVGIQVYQNEDTSWVLVIYVKADET